MKWVLFAIGAACLLFIGWQWSLTPATTGDWQTPLSRLSTAAFEGDRVTVRNVRNFRYEGSEDEGDLRPAYEDRSYDLTNVIRVWYITEPFKGLQLAAHTFLSFEFSDGQFLSITIEARKVKGQEYDLFKGLFHTYPLMYIAADERDAIFVRANIRKAPVYVYPVRTTPQKARVLLTDMLQEMNVLSVHPAWYNTAMANCTSRIAMHVNRISPDRLPGVPWQSWLTGYADAFALEHGFLDTDLPLEQARARYNVTPRSQEIGAVDDYSVRIREFGGR